MNFLETKDNAEGISGRKMHEAYQEMIPTLPPLPKSQVSTQDAS